MMVTQACEYSKKHHIVHFKWMNFMACVLYLNKILNFFVTSFTSIFQIFYSPGPWDCYAKISSHIVQQVTDHLLTFLVFFLSSLV